MIQRISPILDEQCPIYLSYGMTLSQYWDDDPYMAVYFRKLNKINQDRLNEQLWLQGLYIYDALIRLAPIFQPMGGSMPEPYPEKPYELREPTREERVDAEKQQMLDMQAYLEGIIAREQNEEKKGG